MIREALEYLMRCGAEKADAKHIDGDRFCNHYSVNGASYVYTKPVPVRLCELYDIESLAKFDSEESELWFSEDSIALLNGAGSLSEDRYQFELSTTPAWGFLCNSSPMDHKSFIRGIVLNAKAEVDAFAPNFLGTVRRLKFDRHESVETAVAATKDSLGKSVEAQVTGSADIPESIVVTIARWNEFEFSADVEILIDIDLGRQRIGFKPVKSSLMKARDVLADQVRKAIGGHFKKSAVFHGVPGHVA